MALVDEVCRIRGFQEELAVQAPEDPPADGVAEAGTVAASSGDDIPTQLAAVLGYTIKRLRITDEVPPRISVIDVIQAITQMTQDNAGHYFDRIKKAHPEVCTNCANFRFPGRGQRDTPVADMRAVVEIVMLLPGRHAARVRRPI